MASDDSDFLAVTHATDRYTGPNLTAGPQLDRWLLYTGPLYSKIDGGYLRVTVMTRWPLYGGGRYYRFYCTNKFETLFIILVFYLIAVHRNA